MFTDNTQADPTVKDWIDVFPGGLLPMEDWGLFENWRVAHNLATTQPLSDFTDRVNADSENNDYEKIRLFVIGDHISCQQRVVTLLDMSSDFFSQNKAILTIAYNPNADIFETIFGPIMCDNIYSGIHMTLRMQKPD